jgi:hypothetical protein
MRSFIICGMCSTYNTHGRDENVYKILVAKPEGKGPLGILGCKWKDNIRRVQWVPGALSLGVKRQGRETDHSPLSSAEVKD